MNISYIFIFLMGSLYFSSFVSAMPNVLSENSDKNIRENYYITSFIEWIDKQGKHYPFSVVTKIGDKARCDQIGHSLHKDKKGKPVVCYDGDEKFSDAGTYDNLFLSELNQIPDETLFIYYKDVEKNDCIVMLGDKPADIPAEIVQQIADGLRAVGTEVKVIYPIK